MSRSIIKRKAHQLAMCDKEKKNLKVVSRCSLWLCGEKRRSLIFLVLPLLLTAGGYKSAWQNNSAVKEYGLAARAEAKGNSLQAHEYYKRAQAGFKDAAIEDPDSARLQFNQGTAYYKNGDLEAAIRKFEYASADEELQADAYYNLGNSRLTTGDYSGAVQAYRGSLRLDSDRQDSWHNLEVAAKLLAKQEQQQQQQQDGKQGEKKEQQADKRQAEKQQAKQQEAGQEDAAEGDDDKKDKGRMAGEMSEEEAAKMLEALAEMELKALGGVEDRAAGGQDLGMNDW